MLIISLIFLIIAITIHEFAHSFMADKLGDPTPRAYGRLSLNPVKHIDPLGLVALIFFRIGWGKPVPIDISNFRNPKRDEILVSISGPLSNFLLALIAAFITKYTKNYTATALLINFVQLNIFLGIFNLLPIFPLDGSKIFLNLLPLEKSIEWQKDLEKYGYIIILLLSYTGLLQKIISFFANPVLNLLL